MTQFNRSILDFDIGISLSLATLDIVLHGSAIAGVVMSALSWTYQAAFIVAILVSLVYTFWHLVLLNHPRSIVSASYRAPKWQLQRRSGEVVSVTLSSEVYVSRWLIVMNFVDESGQRIGVPVFFDAVPAEQHRHGRVFFRMKGLEVEPS